MKVSAEYLASSLLLSRQWLQELESRDVKDILAAKALASYVSQQAALGLQNN